MSSKSSISVTIERLAGPADVLVLWFITHTTKYHLRLLAFLPRRSSRIVTFTRALLHWPLMAAIRSLVRKTFCWSLNAKPSLSRFRIFFRLWSTVELASSSSRTGRASFNRSSTARILSCHCLAGSWHAAQPFTASLQQASSSHRSSQSERPSVMSCKTAHTL